MIESYIRYKMDLLHHWKCVCILFDVIGIFRFQKVNEPVAIVSDFRYIEKYYVFLIPSFSSSVVSAIVTFSVCII